MAAGSRARWMIEERDSRDSLGRALYSAIVTLTLGVLGSTILPVPYAFSRLGVLPGVSVMLVVAFVNDRTCCMLIRASAATGLYSFEQLAEWAGGKRARVLTQVSLILLLYGTLCGGLAFLSDVCRVMIIKGFPAPVGAFQGDVLAYDHQGYGQQHHLHAGAVMLSAKTAGAMTSNISMQVSPVAMAIPDSVKQLWDQLLALMRVDGRPLMLLVVATVLYPLCLQRHIRQFEKAATVGVIVVIVLMVVVVGKAVAAGFPAVASGELPIWGFHEGGGTALPEAFAVLGFAFYMQPFLVPLLAEMPGGEGGRWVSETAVHTVLFGVACAAYGLVGIFGAATYGDATQSNIMVNDLLPGQPEATLALYASLLLYLCCGMVTTHYALRASVWILITQSRTTEAGADMSASRRVLLTTCIILAALAVAVTFPTYAERIFALTGCTAVALVCYVIPVYIHVTLEERLHKMKSNPAAILGQHPCVLPGLRIIPAPYARHSLEETNTPSSGPEFMIVPPASPGTMSNTETMGTRLVQPINQAWVPSPGQPAKPPIHDTATLPMLEDPLLQEASESPHTCGHSYNYNSNSSRRSCCHLLHTYALPALIVGVGVSCSLAGLYVGVVDIMNSWNPQ